jgi:protein-S-isoprenylcysteine O-methyltransferase Ste14
MYLGFFLMMTGTSIFAGSIPLVCSAFIFLSAMNFVFCPYEEAQMKNLFRKDYPIYVNTVRGWI